MGFRVCPGAAPISGIVHAWSNGDVPLERSGHEREFDGVFDDVREERVISVRRAGARRLEPVLTPQQWHTFHAEGPAPDHAGFHVLEHLDEARLPPDEELPHGQFIRAEWLTYVFEGSVSYEDERGRRGVLRAGEFQRASSAFDRRQRESNVSRTEWAHFFQFGLHPSATPSPGHQECRFSVADRRDVLCLVASPDATNGVLRLDQDVRLYSSCLDPGHHLVHELAPGRVAWVHVVRGGARVMEEDLLAGDGAGVTGERVVSLTADGETEVLLFDVSEHHAGGNGVVA